MIEKAYLKVLLAVEGDGLSFHLSVLDVYFVTAQHNGNVLADTNQILVPCGHVLVCDTRGDVEHDDGALALDVVAVTQTAELLLTGSVPHVECNRTTVGGERQRMHLDAQSRDVLLLELTGQVTLHERGLAHTTVANEHQLLIAIKCID
jgi:hypothetical protein